MSSKSNEGCCAVAIKYLVKRVEQLESAVADKNFHIDNLIFENNKLRKEKGCLDE